MVGLLPHSGDREKGKGLPFPLSQVSLPACLPQVTSRSFQVHTIISSNICYLRSFPTCAYTAIPGHHNRRLLGPFTFTPPTTQALWSWLLESTGVHLHHSVSMVTTMNPFLDLNRPFSDLSMTKWVVILTGLQVYHSVALWPWTGYLTSIFSSESQK